MSRNLWLAAFMITIFVAPTFAQDAMTYLPPKKAAAIIADGQPWSSTGPDGKPLTLILNGDGTGSIKGPMPFKLSVKWSLKGDAICLIGMMGTKCLRFQEVVGGYQGWENGKPEMKLSR